MLDILQCTFWAFDMQYWNRLVPYIEKSIIEQDFSMLKAFDFRQRHVNDFQSAVYFLSPENVATRNPVKEKSIAVLEVVGPVTKYGGMCSFGTKDYIQQLQSALDNPNVSGILLYVDSPGGSVDGTEELANFVQKASQQKPIVAFADGLMASAAYWIASQSNYIYANSGTTCWVGSIGTLIMHIDQSSYLEKQGLKVTYLTADRSTQKVLGNPTQPLSEDAVASFKESLNVVNDTFVKAVEKGRSEKLSTQKDVFTGATFSGKDAQKYGLIDNIGTMQNALNKVRKLAKIKEITN